MSWLELKIPPPVLALLLGLIMWLASFLGVSVEVPFVFRVGVALIVASVGLVIGVASMASFWRAKTTMNPTKPAASSVLVTSGAFRFTRNPMYLSLLLYLLAWAVYLSSLLPLIFVPVYVLYMNQFQIKPEERTLSSLFGQDYAAYKERVRRWL